MNDLFENDDGDYVGCPALKPYQAAGVDGINNRFEGRCLLADDMGLGKTIQALCALRAGRNYLPALVICPATVKTNWMREALEFTGFRADVIDGLSTSSLYREQKPLTIINYDIVPQWLGYLKYLNPKTIIFDEAQYLSNIGTQRYGAVAELVETLDIKNRIALTGQPVNNHLRDLWPVLRLIRPDVFRKPCDVSPQMLRSVLMIRRLKEQVMPELPKLERHVTTLAIDNRYVYSRAEADFIAWLEDYDPEKVTQAKKAEGLVKVGYLRRLAALGKMPSACRWINKQPDKKMILFAVHRRIIGGLGRCYGSRAVVLDGSKTRKQRQSAIDSFTRDDHVRLMIANIDAGGCGWNGQIASKVAFVELPWTPGKLLQAEKRIDRIGQLNKRISAHYLVAEQTIEERVCQILQDKQSAILAGLDGKLQTKQKLLIYDQLISQMRPKGFFSWFK